MCTPACSCDQLADATGGFDALLGDFGEHLGADDAWLFGQLALTTDLEEALNQQSKFII